MDAYNPYCPDCGVELDFFDHYDECDEGDIVLFRARGTCPKCRKHYLWNDVYKLAGFQDVEEYDWTER